MKDITRAREIAARLMRVVDFLSLGRLVDNPKSFTPSFVA